MSEVAPKVVPASFFIMASFLVALASAASRCGFHVKHVLRVTPRNVGVSTFGTGWLLDFSDSCCSIDLKMKSLSLLFILPCTPARRSFNSSPSFQTLSKAFDRSKKTPRIFFSWKASSMFVLEQELSLSQDAM